LSNSTQALRRLAFSLTLCLPSAWAFAGDENDDTQDRLKITPTGYVQLDYRSFPDWETEIGKVSLARDERELRRFRLGFEAEYRDWRFEVDVDPSEKNTGFLKDAFVDLRLSRALRLRAGHFKLPFDEEQLSSASRLDFAERSRFASAIAPGRDFGLMAHGRLSNRLSYATGVFVGDGWTLDAPEGRGFDLRSDVTVASRVAFAPGGGLRLGGGVTLGRVSEDDNDLARGWVGEAVSGYSYFPAHHVNGRRLRTVLNSSWSVGRLTLKADVGQGRDQRKEQGADRSDLPDLVSTGWSTSAHWLIAGRRDKTRVDAGKGLFSGIGAIEASLRYESLSFDDSAASGDLDSPASRAASVRAASVRSLTAGLSWWPKAWARILGNISWERFGLATLAPEVGRPGNYVTVSVRTQLRIP
jgi:phosphate-selective porin